MQPLTLAKLESFYVGGELQAFVNSAGAADERVVGAMYVQRMKPLECHFPFPVVFVHGGCHTGVTWETTPDGREGWAQLFVRRGFETYVVDQAWRGRSAPLLDPTPSAAIAWSAGLSTIALFSRSGYRFPAAHAQAYAAQFWPDLGIAAAVERGHAGLSDARALPPLVALLDRIGPAILVTHSQGSDLGWQAALTRPGAVAGILAVEPGITKLGLDRADFPNIPVRIMWGDNLPDDAVALTRADLEEAKDIAARNRNVSVDWLPEAGIRGNGHMLMMEDNSAELADRAMEWLRMAVAPKNA